MAILSLNSSSTDTATTFKKSLEILESCDLPYYPLPILRSVASIPELLCCKGTRANVKEVLSYLIKRVNLKDIDQPLRIPRQNIADYIYRSVDTVGRVLRYLKEMGLIDYCRQSLENNRGSVSPITLTEKAKALFFKQKKSLPKEKQSAQKFQSAFTDIGDMHEILVPNDVLWLHEEKNLSDVEIFTLMRDCKNKKYQLVHVAEYHKASLMKINDAKGVFAYLKKMIVKEQHDYVWWYEQAKIRAEQQRLKEEKRALAQAREDARRAQYHEDYVVFMNDALGKPFKSTVKDQVFTLRRFDGVGIGSVEVRYTNGNYKDTLHDNNHQFFEAFKAGKIIPYVIEESTPFEQTLCCTSAASNTIIKPLQLFHKTIDGVLNTFKEVSPPNVEVPNPQKTDLDATDLTYNDDSTLDSRSYGKKVLKTLQAALAAKCSSTHSQPFNRPPIPLKTGSIGGNTLSSNRSDTHLPAKNDQNSSNLASLKIGALLNKVKIN